MKNLRSFCAATALTLVLTSSAWAGEMGYPKSASTCDSPTPDAVSEQTPNEGTDVYSPETELLLNFLQTMLSIF